jgi:6-phosphogluconolactonase (cycloisomerase 2 family)
MKHDKPVRIILGFLAFSVAGCGSASHATASTGPYVHIANTKSNKISQYRAAANRGALTPSTPATVATGPFPYTIAVDRQGTSAYATSSASEVSQYTINPITGQLTPKSPPTVITRSGGTAAIAFTPNGTSVYVVGNNISQYSIDATTGNLTSKL